MPWDTDDSSGLLSHFIGTVNESVWTTDSQRQDPNKPFMSWQVTVDDILQENFAGTAPETLTVNISIGNGWVEDETGATVEHKDGLESFKSQSAYGRIIGIVAGKADDYGAQAVVKDGDGEVDVDLADVAKYMNANGYDDPRVSAIWTGFQFEFRGIGFKFRDQSLEDVFANVLPVKVVNVPGDTPKAAKPKGGKAKAQRDTVGVWTSNGADDETASTLNDLANKAGNHAEFAREALVLPAVQGNDDLKAAVMDASVFA